MFFSSGKQLVNLKTKHDPKSLKRNRKEKGNKTYPPMTLTIQTLLHRRVPRLHRPVLHPQAHPAAPPPPLRRPLPAPQYHPPTRSKRKVNRPNQRSSGATELGDPGNAQLSCRSG